MKYIGVLILPFLMLADYYLTIIGAILAEKKYSEFFIAEQYELNPNFQTEINSKKLFNLRHLISVLLYTAFMLYLASDFSYIPYFVFEILFGFFVILYLIIMQRHIYNILIFRYVNENSAVLEGSISMKYEYSLKSSEYSNLAFLPTLLIIFVLTNSLYILGGVFSVIYLLIHEKKWMKQHKKKDVENEKKQVL